MQRLRGENQLDLRLELSHTVSEKERVGESITGRTRGQVIQGIMVWARCLNV